MARPAPAKPAAAAPVAPAAPVPKLSATVDAGFDVRIVADLELKLDDPKLKAELALGDVPLMSQWRVAVSREKDKDAGIEILHNKLDEGALGTMVNVSMTVSWTDDGKFREICTSRWSGPAPALNTTTKSAYGGWRVALSPSELETAQTASNGRFNPSRLHKYRLLFEIRRVGLVSAATSAELAPLVSELNTMALAPKVRLCINGRPDAELWTTERLLTTSSSYFGNLFRSGIAETVTIGVKRARTRSSTVEQAAASRRLLYKAPVAKQLVEDSDRETDALTFQGKLGQVPPAPHDPLDDGEIPYKQVTVEHAAYTTYRAVLLYLSTGFIQFAPLASSFAAAPVPREARTAALLALHIVDPFLPVPASPNSVYRLADVLDLKQLKTMALRFVRDEALTVSTAPAELFSELARDNVEWRTMILDWIMERWDEVEGCEGWTATMQRVEKGEIDGAASLMVEVLRRVAKRKGVKS